MCMPYAVMQPGKLVANITEEIISGPQKSLKDVHRLRKCWEQIQNEHHDSLGKEMLDCCVSQIHVAESLDDLAAMCHTIAIRELIQVSMWTQCDYRCIHASVLYAEYDIPLDEIAHLFGCDVDTIDTRAGCHRHDLELAVRRLLASRWDADDGRTLTWFDIREEIQGHFRDIQSLIADIHRIYEEYAQWDSDLSSSNSYCAKSPEQLLEYYATGEDCDECRANHSEAYRLAAHLLRDYDNRLVFHLDAATRLTKVLADSKMDDPKPIMTPYDFQVRFAFRDFRFAGQ